MIVLEWIGNVLITVSVICIFIGLVGVFRFQDFYAKILASSKIDTVAFITLLLGLALRSSSVWFILKSGLILLFVLFINPIVTSKIVLGVQKDTGGGVIKNDN